MKHCNRYTQPPGDFWEWFSPYLEDEEEVDVRAGGGHVIPIGEMIRQFLTKLDWYSTLFPRIPVPIQKKLEQQLKEYDLEKRSHNAPEAPVVMPAEEAVTASTERLRRDIDRRPSPPFDIAKEFEREGKAGSRHRSPEGARPKESKEVSHSRDRSREHHRSKERDHRRSRERDHRRSRSRERDHRQSRSREGEYHRHKEYARRDQREYDHHRDKDQRDKYSKSHRDRRSRSRDKHSSSHRENSFERDLMRERERVDKEKRHKKD